MRPTSADIAQTAIDAHATGVNDHDAWAAARAEHVYDDEDNRRWRETVRLFLRAGGEEVFTSAPAVVGHARSPSERFTKTLESAMRWDVFVRTGTWPREPGKEVESQKT